MTTTVGSGAHTFEVYEDWARLPEGWDAPMADVAVDSQGRVYGFNRGEHSVIVFDGDGNYLFSWGGGLFASPHAITTDDQDNVWIVDRDNGQVLKFTPEGNLLLTIGTKGYRSDTGADPSSFDSSSYKGVTHGGGPFNMPAGVAISRAGEVFVADGYANCQVHRFAPDGTHLSSWGDPGSGPGQFMLPHGVWVDGQDRVLVADRENDRVQVFTQDGQLLTVWEANVIGPAGFHVDADGFVYVPEHNAGFFSVLSAEGKLVTRWGSEDNKTCHGVTGDAAGDIYFVQRVAGAEGRHVVKYVRKRG